MAYHLKWHLLLILLNHISFYSKKSIFSNINELNFLNHLQFIILFPPNHTYNFIPKIELIPSNIYLILLNLNQAIFLILPINFVFISYLGVYMDFHYF